MQRSFSILSRRHEIGPRSASASIFIRCSSSSQNQPGSVKVENFPCHHRISLQVANSRSFSTTTPPLDTSASSPPLDTPPEPLPQPPSILGHGMTDIISVSEDEDGRKKIILDGYTESGFDVADVHFLGSVMCLSHTVLNWSPTSLQDISVESVSFLKYLTPAIGVLVIGTPRMQLNRDVMDKIREAFRDTETIVEFMDTTNACATFNILNGEDRKVVAALLCISEDTTAG